ncbi:alpha/beta fold hydrolase [Shewanella sp. FJAT-52076]|uniref:alpha/beta fold hydrolase n=1 Tax=Shewanella sp. FJAT-52076 TaxID=2864202 RepID=UPI001C65C873|nr:alpha/beta hydrolase [Shewanella sp. FJAT-52076]QYJ77172.1 alpha/beta hydrolase [Shewanella sp. FJAT-52076]
MTALSTQTSSSPQQKDTISQQSLFLPYDGGQLHLRHISPASPSTARSPLLMLHGAMSNGRVFYSDSGRGLASFLARQGFEVYVLDTAGRGLSTPKLSKGIDPGQGKVIREQLPLVQAFILERHPLTQGVHWCGHSWGGVLMASSLVRYPDMAARVRSLLTFGSKRTIRTRSLKKWWMVDMFWNRLAPAIATQRGYLPADSLKLGMDNESIRSLSESIDWVRGDWIDHDDGFDYANAARANGLPPAWFIAGARDTVLGNPSDVKDMMAECCAADARYTLLSRESGYRHDYDHAGMLTHLDAPSDHFIQVADWLLGFDVTALKDPLN